ncbi:hypothetical protein [Nitrospina gracilis]|uniref:hypothetical protein n=1 Tax=Nitrospina gracilis TaxID=35801 RepID=UPI001F3D9EF6|nr:hypothetical protein [Nitrospina gracilis]MCF8720065.1 hypothetical protein [Nitrospina gracilis Nb-211]
MPLNIPSSDHVIQDLTPTLKLIHEALQFATEKAKSYFYVENPDEKIDPYTGAMLTRYWAKFFINKCGYSAEFDSDLELKNSPNVGLILRSENYHIRILKSCNGNVPVAGHSRKRQKFYEQAHFEFEVIPENRDLPLNLLVIWVADSDLNINELSLACPREGGALKDSVKCHWHQPFPDSLTNLESQFKYILEEDVPEDLPIAPNLNQRKIKNDNWGKNKTS